MVSFPAFVPSSWSSLLLRRVWRTRCTANLTCGNARVVARAASAIAQHRWPGCEVELLRALRAWAQRDDADRDIVGLFLLDALVQVGAVVPGAALRPFTHGVTATVAFVLLARAARINEAELLRTFQDGGRVGDDCRDLRWVAAGHLLATRRTPGFAGALLREVDWRLVVRLGGGAEPAAPVTGCVAAAGAPLGRHDGFPPLPAYALAPAGQGGEVLAAGEPTVVFRRALADGRMPCGTGATNLARALRVRWLAALADGARVPVDVVVTVPWRGSDALRAVLARHVAVLQDERRRLFHALLVGGAVTPAEAVAANRPPRLVVYDLRGHDGPPLALGDHVVVRRLPQAVVGGG